MDLVAIHSGELNNIPPAVSFYVLRVQSKREPKFKKLGFLLGVAVSVCSGSLNIFLQNFIVRGAMIIPVLKNFLFRTESKQNPSC